MSSVPKKVWVGVGVIAACAVAGIGAYFAYQKISSKKSEEEAKQEKPKKTQEKEENKEDEGEWEDASDKDSESQEIEKQGSLTDIMDEVLVESIEFIFRFTGLREQLENANPEDRELMIEQIQANIQQMISEIEKTICEKHGWKVSDYTDQVGEQEDAKNPYIFIVF